MDADAKAAEKKQRRAEALRANLRRRKAALGGRLGPPAKRETDDPPEPARDGERQVEK